MVLLVLLETLFTTTRTVETRALSETHITAIQLPVPSRTPLGINRCSYESSVVVGSTKR